MSWMGEMGECTVCMESTGTMHRGQVEAATHDE